MNKSFKGDLGFMKHITLAESALKHKKFYFLLKLFDYFIKIEQITSI